MYKNIIDSNELIGKTIKDVKIIDLYSKIGLVFDDESFCLISTYQDQDDFKNIELIPVTETDYEIFYEFGFISWDEYEKILDGIEKQERKLDEQTEYELYLKLRDKFENNFVKIKSTKEILDSNQITKFIIENNLKE